MPDVSFALDAVLLSVHREASLQTCIQDADAELDHSVDWSDWLGAAESITTNTWTVDEPCTILGGGQAPSEANGITTAWVKTLGATPGRKYLVRNHIETDAGRKDDRSFWLRIVGR